MLLWVGATTTSMSQPLFPSKIETQSCHVTFLTTKTMVRKQQKMTLTCSLCMDKACACARGFITKAINCAVQNQV